MDLTTSLRAGGRQANGTLRIERNYACALKDIFGGRLAFCRYDALRQRFVPAPGPSDAAMERAPGARRTEGQGLGVMRMRADHLGRRLERSLRRSTRRLATTVLGKIASRHAARHFPEGRRGDVLFLAGETWGPRYDLGVVAALRLRQGIAVAALCQDLIPVKHPQFFDSTEFVDRYHRYAEFLIAHTDLLITISQSTRADVLEFARHNDGRIRALEVVRPAAEIREVAHALAINAVADRPFVLSVSTIQSRKNFELLYRVWQRFGDEGRDVPRLVIVGQRGFGTNDLLFQIARDPRVRNSVKILHAVSDSELAWLYRNCLFTLYPSFDEGWGLPISESLAYGKCCIASDIPALREAGEGLARHLDPLDVLAWRNLVLELTSRPQALEEIQSRIRACYRPRTWLASAREVAAALAQLSGDTATHEIIAAAEKRE